MRAKQLQLIKNTLNEIEFDRAVLKIFAFKKKNYLTSY